MEEVKENKEAMNVNNTLDPIYWRVVKYYELKKEVRKGLEVPFVLAYMRPYTKLYADIDYHDRVDIDIQAAISDKYPGAAPQIIHMQTETNLNTIRQLAAGVHYNAAIQFIDDGILTNNGLKLYRNPGRIEQLLSLYVQDEQNALYLANELGEFILPGGGIIDYHFEEYYCKCEKLSFHPLLRPALLYVGIGDEKRKLLFYNLSKPWINTTVLYIEDLGDNQNIISMFGDQPADKEVISRLIIDVTDRSRFYRVGNSGNDTDLYKNTRDLFCRLFANKTDQRVKDALASFDKFEEI